MRAFKTGGEIRIDGGYLHRESIKEIEGRRYDAINKVWYIPLNEKNAALMQLLGVELCEELRATLKAQTALAREGYVQPTMRLPIRASPYQHQIAAFNYALGIFDSGRRGVALFADMGTGKTLITIAVAGTLNAAGKVKRLLVVCPKSIVGVWSAEFCKFAGFDYAAAVLEGSTAKKADTLRHIGVGGGLQVVIVNYESAWRLEAELLKFDADMIVCDESSKIKTAQAQQSKVMHRLGAAARFKMLLTGTPITNNPQDFFSQYKFADAEIFGLSYYSYMRRYTIPGGYGNRQIIGYKNMAELVEKAHSIAFRIKLEDAVDLPEKIDEIRSLELEPNAKKIYQSIDQESYAELMQGEVTTRNILTRLLRLSQCTGGYIRNDEGGLAQEVSRAKLDALEDILDECGSQKVVIFARFIPEIEAIEKLLKKRNVKYSVIHGGITDRAEQVAQFQNDSDCRVFIGQLQTTSMGLTLTAANVAVFYSLDFSFANYEQSRARIHRIGQTQKCLYIHLVAKGTVDEQVMSALKTKGDIARLMVDDYKKISGGS